MNIIVPELISEIKNHSRKVRDEAEKIKDQALKWLLKDEAPKRELVEWITIDKYSSKDLDDLIWAEKTKNWYSIFVSIADVSEVIKPNTILDLDAFSRSTSVYTSTHTYHKFPEDISTDILSLNHQTKRNTITTRIEYDNNFNIVWSNIYESVSYNKNRFDYEEFNKQFNDYYSEFHSELNLFHEIAKWLYKKRISWWARYDFNEHVWLKIWKESSWINTISSFIIQEFMLATNIENAKILFKERINWIFRIHMPEYKWVTSSISSNQRAFYNYNHWFHYWLWENFYWHFTSPIRRYADLINHRQQKAWLRKDWEIYTKSDIRKIIININSTIEKTIELENNYNKEVNDKRIERFIKKLSDDNYNNVSSISEERFSWLIKYFVNKPEYFKNEKIMEEIIYRIDNKLIWEKSIWRMRSTPKANKDLDFLREYIDKKNTNIIY